MGYNGGIITMGGRAGGGGAGGGKGGGTRSIQSLANKIVGGFSSDQKGVYNAMVAKGFNSVYAANAVAGAKSMFGHQPLSWIQGQMVGKHSAADVARINQAMSNTPNKLIAQALKAKL